MAPLNPRLSSIRSEIDPNEPCHPMVAAGPAPFARHSWPCDLVLRLFGDGQGGLAIFVWAGAVPLRPRRPDLCAAWSGPPAHWSPQGRELPAFRSAPLSRARAPLRHTRLTRPVESCQIFALKRTIRDRGTTVMAASDISAAGHLFPQPREGRKNRGPWATPS
jgi:hypothetical protein